MQAGNEGSLPFFPCSSSPNSLTMVSDFLFLLELKLGWGEEKIYTRMRKFLYDYYHCNVALCSLGLDDVNFNFFFFFLWDIFITSLEISKLVKDLSNLVPLI